MDNNYIFPFLWMRGEPEEVLREEMAKIYGCGIRSVCVEARPHKDFCGPGWWHDMDIILDEARQRDMNVWILDDRHFPTGYANGLIESKYPERKKQYLACTTADVFGSRRSITLNVQRMLKPTIGFWQIGDPVDYEERARNTLLASVALPFAEGDCFHEGGIDLTDQVRDGYLTCTLPAGQWRIHVLYCTRTDGGDPAYINMLDKVSASTQIEGVYEAHYARYADEFGKTIAGFFSDEPQFGNIPDQTFDTRLGKRKMPLPWSQEMEAMLQERHGDALTVQLPFLFADSADHAVQPQIRYDYMDCASRLYERNFSRPVGEWCQAHGVEYIGHVVEDNSVHSRLGLGAAHYFRAMAGQHMAGIDVIGGQYCFGAPVQLRRGMVDAEGEFTHYALGKLGASAGHLDPKKKGRTMCELFGAYGWNFGVRDMKYLLDFVLSQGVNRLVPHAFSMAEYPDADCPPHFYARGNNPEYPWFAQLMQYAQRMCGLLSGGTHRASAAVLYDGEADWAGERMPMQKVCRVLAEHQIDFDIVPLDMLCDLPAYNGSIENGVLTINGVSFGALMIPRAQYIPARLSAFLRNAKDLPVYFVDGRPDAILQDAAGTGCPEDLAAAQVCALAELPAVLEGLQVVPLKLTPAFPHITAYQYEKQGRQILFLQNGDPDVRYQGTLTATGERSYQVWDAMADRCYSAGAAAADGATRIPLDLAPGESIVLMEGSCQAAPWQSLLQRTEGCAALDLSHGWKVSRAKAKDYPHMEDLGTWDALTPESDRDPAFSGILRYEKTITLPENAREAYLSLEELYEVLRAQVDGEDRGMVLTPPYVLPLGALSAGEHTITVEVATTPGRDQLNYPKPPFDFSHEAMEPTGLAGTVQLWVR